MVTTCGGGYIFLTRCVNWFISQEECSLPSKAVLTYLSAWTRWTIPTV